ncbi:MAG: FAD-dependent oxidoreductase [Candidatus Neomarinimicrobiota bacterium]|nr:MAG: FAD-dependent oxidoreductase [Candidatus Neomarinimicrobiota bacterium]
MSKTFDVIIIGGGITGTATGYYLSKKGLRVLLLEKNFLTSGSTGRCITGIRQQFSTPATIQIAMESVRLFRSMKEELGLDVEWKNSGYLFLAHSRETLEMFKRNIAIQTKFGLDVKLISKEECKGIVPLMETEELLGGAWCPSDGQANPFLVVKGYADGIRRNGGKIETGTEAVKITVEKGRVQSVTTSSGDTYTTSKILNAAGPWAKDVGKMVGIDIPVEPERHEALITEGVQYIGVPMLVDYRPDGGYFVQRVTGQFIGCFTPEKRDPGRGTKSTLEFLVEMSRRMYRLVPALKNVAVLRQWAGSYSMTPDGNPIVDKTEVAGFYCSVGMSGHGFMLGPALGKFMAQYMTEGRWPISMEELSYGRSFGEKESLA